MAALEWFRQGRPDGAYPKVMADEDGGTSAMYITREGVFCYGKTDAPQRLEDPFTAMGHGRDFALAAMHLGCDALRAVEVACELDIFCGCGIDTLTLEG
jgi:hypothetical protein